MVGCCHRGSATNEPPRPPSSLPAGFLGDALELGTDRLTIVAHPVAAACCCLSCDEPSIRVHSHYQRRLLDLPSHGRIVELQLLGRRFRCRTAAGVRRTFVEPLPLPVGQRFGQRTSRLDGLVQHLGLVLGGRSGAGAD
ncbi:transposase family protein [Falsiroseomonas sp. HC035]|uniref:transposase family protein n=1 Tax=Falsiroseomonas sp. HC035 TaxID=3390999 RepID=UPI003D315834